MNKYTIKLHSEEVTKIDGLSHNFSDKILTVKTKGGQSIYTEVLSFSYEEIPESKDDKIARLEKELEQSNKDYKDIHRKLKSAETSLYSIRNALDGVKFYSRKSTIKACYIIADEAYRKI